MKGKNRDAVMVATRTYWDFGGDTAQRIVRGRTRAHAGHEIVNRNPKNWAPADEHVHYPVEQATDGPGEKRGDTKNAKADEKPAVEQAAAETRKTEEAS